MKNDWRGIKYDVALMEYCFKDKFFEPFHLYAFMRLVGHKTAGYVRQEDLINEFAAQSGYSERKIKVMLRLLKKRGWVLKLGPYFHVTSLDRIKNQVLQVRPDLKSKKSERLSWRDIVIDKKVFKANCVEYFKAKLIESRFNYERRNCLLDLEKSAISNADNSYWREKRFGDCSYRLASHYLGLSISHLHELSKIQRGPSGGKHNKYHKRYCSVFDKANITSLDDVKEHVKAANEYGENLDEAMFQFHRVMCVNPIVDEGYRIYRPIKRYRRRLSDWIAVGVELTKRRSNKVSSRKKVEGLFRLIPNTKSGVKDLNRIIDFYNTSLISPTG